MKPVRIAPTLQDTIRPVRRDPITHIVIPIKKKVINPIIHPRPTRVVIDDPIVIETPTTVSYNPTKSQSRTGTKSRSSQSGTKSVSGVSSDHPPPPGSSVSSRSDPAPVIKRWVIKKRDPRYIRTPTPPQSDPSDPKVALAIFADAIVLREHIV